MATNSIDILTYGDNATRGPLYDKSVVNLAHGTFTSILPVNPNRKFLLIKPLSNHIHVHFLSPGALPASISDANSITVASGNADEPLMFDRFVPTNEVYIKTNTGSTNIAIFES